MLIASFKRNVPVCEKARMTKYTRVCGTPACLYWLRALVGWLVGLLMIKLL